MSALCFLKRSHLVPVSATSDAELAGVQGEAVTSGVLAMYGNTNAEEAAQRMSATKDARDAAQCIPRSAGCTLLLLCCCWLRVLCLVLQAFFVLRLVC